MPTSPERRTAERRTAERRTAKRRAAVARTPDEAQSRADEVSAELMASETRLQAALDTMVGAIVVASAVRDEAGSITDFRIEYSSATIGATAGVPSDHQVGHTLLELFPAHRADGRFEAFAGVVETGVTCELPEFHFVDPDAAAGPLDQYIDQYVAKMGDGYVTSIRNVTERHRASAELHRLSTAIEQSEDGILIADTDMRITYANAVFAANFGQKLSDLVGRNALEVIGTTLDATTMARIAEIIGLGKSWLGEIDSHGIDGSDRRLQLRFTARVGGNEEPGSLIVNFRDVTELRRGESEMRRLSMAMEQSADAIMITDAEANIEYVNPAFERVSGYTRAEVLGQNPRILQSGVHQPPFYEAMWAALTSGNSFVGDLLNRAKDGSLFQEDAVISPVLGPDGTPTSYVAVKRDVTRERAREATAVRVARERDQIAESLTSLRVGLTPEATAEAICREVIRLGGISGAGLARFSIEGPLVPLAFRRKDGKAVPLEPLPVQRAEIVRERLMGGPWVEPWVRQAGHPFDVPFLEMGVRAMAYAPIRYGGDLVGILTVASSEEDATSHLTESLPTLLELAVGAGALVGPTLAGLTEAGELRKRIIEIIHEGLFRPVFQPILELESRETVGFEALTRFGSGQPPNLCFAEARAVDLGLELELATLVAAVGAAHKLPAGRWLSLNVSPRLLLQTERLQAVLGPSERPLYLEVTEHENIDNYTGLTEALRALGPNVRLAVDDAGAGIANFGHIVELRPHLVKLDIGLVRDVNNDLGRQALVVAMSHFARQASCRLLAEGIETEQEAGTLGQLHVELGQGYLFGRPEPVEMWANAGKTDGASRRGRGPALRETKP